jgi:hypothetical protein
LIVVEKTIKKVPQPVTVDTNQQSTEIIKRILVMTA